MLEKWFAAGCFSAANQGQLLQINTTAKKANLENTAAET
jgi:hypothetical protein